MIIIRPKFLIVGTIRNCGARITAEYNRINTAFAAIGETKWLIVESDSDDNTTEKLHLLSQSTADFNYLSLGKLSPSMPKRTHRIAHCRNLCLEQIKINPNYSNSNYIVVADLDGVNSKLTPAAVASCFTRDDWDACFANQDGPYYDIWALRHRFWSPNDYWDQYNFLISQSVKPHIAIRIAHFSRSITIPGDGGWIEVDSAFGGLGIYRRSIFVTGSYNGTSIHQGELCEHVQFHEILRQNGAKLFIVPSLINNRTPRLANFISQHIYTLHLGARSLRQSLQTRLAKFIR